MLHSFSQCLRCGRGCGQSLSSEHELRFPLAFFFCAAIPFTQPEQRPFRQTLELFERLIECLPCRFRIHIEITDTRARGFVSPQ